MLQAPPDNQSWFCKKCGTEKGGRTGFGAVGRLKGRPKKKVGAKRGRKRLH